MVTHRAIPCLRANAEPFGDIMLKLLARGTLDSFPNFVAYWWNRSAEVLIVSHLPNFRIVRDSTGISTRVLNRECYRRLENVLTLA
jgi:hypothetical protein